MRVYGLHGFLLQFHDFDSDKCMYKVMRTRHACDYTEGQWRRIHACMRLWLFIYIFIYFLMNSMRLGFHLSSSGLVVHVRKIRSNLVIFKLSI